MNALFVATAGPNLQPRACEPLLERTVYLRRQAQGWVVSVDGAFLLSTIDEDAGFRCACDARHVGGGEPLRLLILSCPWAAAYAWPEGELNERRAALKPASSGAAVHQDRDDGATQTHHAEVAA